jgi:hypothetical protein
MKIRHPAVEGSFYPSDTAELDAMLNDFDMKISVGKKGRVRAMIVPHAGLFFSGLTAAYAYKYAQGEKYRSAVIFAPSHRVAFYGISGGDFDEYMFCGNSIPVNTELLEKLKKSNGLLSINQAHIHEHSAEVQLPFIKKYLDIESIVVFVYGETEYEKISYVIDDILDEDKDIVIISSDLSHYHPYDECRKTDSVVADGIRELDAAKAGRGEACGMPGIKAIISSAVNKKLNPEILDYRNSGDIINDRSGVVGYLSAVFI